MSVNSEVIFCLSNSDSFSKRVSPLLWDIGMLLYLAEEHNDI